MFAPTSRTVCLSGSITPLRDRVVTLEETSIYDCNSPAPIPTDNFARLNSIRKS